MQGHSKYNKRKGINMQGHSKYNKRKGIPLLQRRVDTPSKTHSQKQYQTHSSGEYISMHRAIPKPYMTRRQSNYQRRVNIYNLDEPTSKLNCPPIIPFL